MTKKIIALMAVVTVLFVCTFAACDKGTYTNPATGNKLELVTDENGEKVLAEDGELLVYATDENGKFVTDDKGELVTEKQGFIGQIEEDGAVEDFAYIFTLPDGWKKTGDGEFKSGDTKQLSINISDKAFKDAYDEVEALYKAADKNETMEATLEKDVEFLEDTKNVSRVTITQDGTVAVIYIFENSGNTYKVVYGTTEAENAIADSVAVCKYITFKPYTYYPELTSEATTE